MDEGRRKKLSIINISYVKSPWWYYAIVVLFCAVSWRTWKKPSLGLLVGYSVLILVETVLIRKPFVGQHFQPKPFWSWRAWDAQRGQILTNMIMFMPVGILAGRLWKWRGLWAAVGLSATIEVLQLLTSRGLCEFDDVIHNCLGAVIGIGIVMLLGIMSRVEENE